MRNEQVDVDVTTNYEDVIGEASVRSLNDLLDAPGSPPALGDDIPPLWHWMGFPPRSKQSELGIDGHPQVDPLLGVDRLPQRMFAGGRIHFRRSIAVGERLHRFTRVKQVRDRVGHSGNLKIVTMLHEIYVGGALAIEEEQELIYRERKQLDLSVVPQHDSEREESWQWRLEFATSTSALFRYSALTYNAHRIHYDLEYARSVEGYPGLVVSGPYQATCAAEVVRRLLPHRRIESFSFRAVRPAFANVRLRVRAREVVPLHLEVICFGADNHPTLKAEIVLRE